jgi:hypothetical protein
MPLDFLKTELERENFDAMLDVKADLVPLLAPGLVMALARVGTSF